MEQNVWMNCVFKSDTPSIDFLLALNIYLERTEDPEFETQTLRAKILSTAGHVTCAGLAEARTPINPTGLRTPTEGK